MANLPGHSVLFPCCHAGAATLVTLGKISIYVFSRKKADKFEPICKTRRIVLCHGEVSHGFPWQSSFLLPHERRWLSPTQPPAFLIPLPSSLKIAQFGMIAQRRAGYQLTGKFFRGRTNSAQHLYRANRQMGTVSADKRRHRARDEPPVENHRRRAANNQRLPDRVASGRIKSQIDSSLRRRQPIPGRFELEMNFGVLSRPLPHAPAVSISGT
jgi:hypothetical protein